MTAPISDHDLAVIRAQAAEWRQTSNSVALGFRLADHVPALIARLDQAEDNCGGYDDRWLCDDCGGEWDGPDDDLTVGLRYLCAGCGIITVATSRRPWPQP